MCHGGAGGNDLGRLVAAAPDCGAGVAYSYLFSVVLLREGTGGGLSGFAVLFMLPVLWVALYGERWEVFAVVVGVGVAMAAPIVLVGPPEYSTTEWRKLMLLVMVCAVVGWSVKTLVDRLGAALEVQARETANLGRLAALNRTIAAAADSETARDAIARRYSICPKPRW